MTLAIPETCSTKYTENSTKLNNDDNDNDDDDYDDYDDDD